MTDSTNLPARASGVSTDNKLAGISGERAMFHSSFDRTTPEGKIQTYDAMSNAVPVADHLGETINFVHFAAMVVEIADDKTGELNEAIRVILIDDKGVAYAAVSDGLLRSLQNIVSIFGDPSTWDAPLPIQVVEERGRSGFRYMTVKLAKAGK